MTAPKTTLRRGEPVQLKLLGTLRDGVNQILASSMCGITYWVSDKKVLAVSPEGLVTAVGNGEAVVTAITENIVALITVKVILPEPPLVH